LEQQKYYKNNQKGQKRVGRVGVKPFVVHCRQQGSTPKRRLPGWFKDQPLHQMDALFFASDGDPEMCCTVSRVSATAVG
jgi:hypothetical protein